MEQEGVTKFRVHHRQGALPGGEALEEAMARLVAWRQILAAMGLIGQDPARYEGAGYGNVSLRWNEGFVVSGTQTSGLAEIGAKDFAYVERVDLRANSVWSLGAVAPSSESMTHAALYRRASHIGAVLHVHSPLLWRDPALARSPASVAYGTPEMAQSIATLVGNGTSVLAMGGHLDGVVAFGASVEEAGRTLLTAWVEAYTRSHLREAP